MVLKEAHKSFYLSHIAASDATLVDVLDWYVKTKKYPDTLITFNSDIMCDDSIFYDMNVLCAYYTKLFINCRMLTEFYLDAEKNLIMNVIDTLRGVRSRVKLSTRKCSFNKGKFFVTKPSYKKSIDQIITCPFLVRKIISLNIEGNRVFL